jgi:hypothetical protein
MTSPFEALINVLFSRIDTASGPYAMIAVLADAIIFRCASSSVTHNESVRVDAECVSCVWASGARLACFVPSVCNVSILLRVIAVLQQYYASYRARP